MISPKIGSPNTSKFQCDFGRRDLIANIFEKQQDTVNQNTVENQLQWKSILAEDFSSQKNVCHNGTRDIMYNGNILCVLRPYKTQQILTYYEHWALITKNTVWHYTSSHHFVYDAN